MSARVAATRVPGCRAEARDSHLPVLFSIESWKDMVYD